MHIIILKYDIRNVKSRFLIVLSEVDRPFGLIEHPHDTRYETSTTMFYTYQIQCLPSEMRYWLNQNTLKLVGYHVVIYTIAR